MGVIQALSMRDDLGLEAWIEEMNRCTRRLGKRKVKVKANQAGLCPGMHGCQLCGGSSHGAKECKKFEVRPKSRKCYSCGEDGHMARDCPSKDALNTIY